MIDTLALSILGNWFTILKLVCIVLVTNSSSSVSSSSIGLLVTFNVTAYVPSTAFFNLSVSIINRYWLFPSSCTVKDVFTVSVFPLFTTFISVDLADTLIISDPSDGNIVNALSLAVLFFSPTFTDSALLLIVPRPSEVSIGSPAHALKAMFLFIPFWSFADIPTENFPYLLTDTSTYTPLASLFKSWLLL